METVKITDQKLTDAAERIGGKNVWAEIEDKGAGLYKVSSASGKVYAVKIDLANEAKCSCFDFQTRRVLADELCKHILWVTQFNKAQIGINERIEATRNFAAIAVNNYRPLHIANKFLH